MGEAGLAHEYPGIGRLHYFLGNVAMVAAAVFAVTVFGPGSRVMSIMTLVLMAAGVILDVLRLRNIGLSQWFVFVRFLPFGNTLLAIAGTCAQTGWIETRRLDRAGKSILFVEILLIALMLFMILRFRISVPLLV